MSNYDLRGTCLPTIASKSNHKLASVAGRISVAGLCMTLTMGEFPGTFTSQETLMFGVETLSVEMKETVECSSAEFNKCLSLYEASVVYNGVELTGGPAERQDALDELLGGLERRFPIPSGNTGSDVEPESELSNQVDTVDQDMNAIDSADSTESTNTIENSFNDYDGHSEMPELDCSISENFGLPECY
jgi:hypothetical protein